MQDLASGLALSVLGDVERVGAALAPGDGSRCVRSRRQFTFADDADPPGFVLVNAVGWLLPAPKSPIRARSSGRPEDLRKLGAKCLGRTGARR